MLILNRRLHERIIIDGNIIVEVVEIKGSLVRLGIDAPKAISVNRLEVERKKLEEEKRNHG